jgi:diguanylate cyclase (GGDEF)-like protein
VNPNIPTLAQRFPLSPTLPAALAENLRGVDLSDLPTTIRKRMGFTGFSPSLESFYSRYYDSRFRGWMRAGLGIMAIYYGFRGYLYFLEHEADPLNWTFVLLTLAWGTFFGLSYTTIPLRLLQWLTLPFLMVMVWSIVAVNYAVWANGNDHVGAAQVISPFVVGLGLFRFPLRMGVIAIILMMGVLVGAYYTFGLALFPQAAGLIALTLIILVLFYTTLEREARLDFTTRLTLYHLATTDGLTGLANRTYFLEQVAQALAQSTPVTLIIFDVDTFKQVNDTYGHAAGDTALQTIGAILSEVAGKHGVAGRLGGEEFALLLTCPAADPNATARYIMAKVRTTLIPYAHGSFRVTMSGGVATSSYPHTYTVDKLLNSADCLLYQAKHAGRNRVMQG